jgi:CRISPR/Cas system CSM-associated protein Csm3 (group 7 of RAMP superfamily)
MEKGLCDVCKTFGSTVFGGKVQVDDLSLIKELDLLGAELVEVRDGVGIDRDSSTAVPQIKFDYEVVPSVAAFRFCLTAENLDDAGLALLSLGLLEMVSGAVPVGGKSTRGLGRCRLQLESLYHFDFSGGKDLAAERIISYLHQPRGEEGRRDPVTFFQDHIKKGGCILDTDSPMC